ncbi:Tuberous sclerosis 2-like protein [Homalodisca vitripennis]|nr:Tuberous sclerosis 2-like protein [Homalodisca vitripennis]
MTPQDSAAVEEDVSVQPSAPDLDQRLLEDRPSEEENIDNLDFEEISDEELEEEARANKGLGDALGVDWASLVAESRPRVVEAGPGAARRRWQPENILARIGVSMEYAGVDLFNEIHNKLTEKKETTPCDPIIPLITTHLHETLCTIETMIELGQFTGSVRAVFQLIDRCSSIRPESSVMRLINYLSGSVVSAQANWLGKLHSILDRYLHQETRTNIRLRALEVLSNVFQENRLHFEEELIDQVVLPHLERVDEERDMAVRNAEAALVVDVCVGSVADNKHFMELLDILDKILSSAFEMYDSPKTEAEVQDVKTAVEGVIRIFTSAMHHVPSAHAVRAFNMLVSHLEMHYAKPIIFDSVISIRVKIKDCFLSYFRVIYNGGEYILNEDQSLSVLNECFEADTEKECLLEEDHIEYEDLSEEYGSDAYPEYLSDEDDLLKMENDIVETIIEIEVSQQAETPPLSRTMNNPIRARPARSVQNQNVQDGDQLVYEMDGEDGIGFLKMGFFEKLNEILQQEKPRQEMFIQDLVLVLQ